jgi:hypothetical protein
VGVHTPEFPFEKEASNVERAINEDGLTYPVVQDNDYATWTAYGNQYWPAKYLIDARGRVRFVHFGEGSYAETERAIRSLLAEAGHQRLGGEAKARAETADPAVTTPESYLGASRADRFANGLIRPGRHLFGAIAPSELPPDQLAYAGGWSISDSSATAQNDAVLTLSFQARRVFLVMGSRDRPRPVRGMLDGHPIPDSLAGEDVDGSKALVSTQRLYRLVDLPRAGRHVLSLRFAPGVAGYAFTFG